MTTKHIEMTYKVVMLGECGTGKSSIADKFVNDNFQLSQTSTIGVDFFNKIVEYNDKVFKIQIWDTAGQEKFYNLVCSYFRDCALGIIVFDITNRISFESVDFWKDKFDLYSSSTRQKPVILVGNKSDTSKNRAVSEFEAISKAEEIGCDYIECSAKEGTNLEEIFNKVIQIIYDKIQDGTIDPKTTSGIKINPQMEHFYLYKEKDPEPKCCTIL